MVHTKDDGGPAFPEAIAIGPAGDVHPGFGGMSLRDYMAATALPAVIRATSAGQHNAGALRGLPDDASMEMRMAADAYAIADAMLEARSK